MSLGDKDSDINFKDDDLPMFGGYIPSVGLSSSASGSLPNRPKRSLGRRTSAARQSLLAASEPNFSNLAKEADVFEGSKLTGRNEVDSKTEENSSTLDTEILRPSSAPASSVSSILAAKKLDTDITSAGEPTVKSVSFSLSKPLFLSENSTGKSDDDISEISSIPIIPPRPSSNDSNISLTPVSTENENKVAVSANNSTNNAFFFNGSDKMTSKYESLGLDTFEPVRKLQIKDPFATPSTSSLELQQPLQPQKSSALSSTYGNNNSFTVGGSASNISPHKQPSKSVDILSPPPPVLQTIREVVVQSPELLKEIEDLKLKLNHLKAVEDAFTSLTVRPRWSTLAFPIPVLLSLPLMSM